MLCPLNLSIADEPSAPAWINSVPQDKTIYWGIGELKTKRRSPTEEEKQMAYQYAVSELSLMVGQTIYSSFLGYEQEVADNSEVRIEREIVSSIKVIGQNYLKGIEIRGRWFDKYKKEYYIFTVIDRAEANRQVEENSFREDKILREIISTGIKQLESKVAELENNLATFDGKVNRTNQKIDSLFTEFNQFKDKIETLSEGEINWTKGLIRVVGYGVPNMNFSPPARRISAKKAARLDAQAQLVELTDGLKLESKTFMKDHRLEANEKIKEVKGQLKWAYQVGKTIYREDGSAEVTMEVNIRNILPLKK